MRFALFLLVLCATTFALTEIKIKKGHSFSLGRRSFNKKSKPHHHSPPSEISNPDADAFSARRKIRNELITGSTFETYYVNMTFGGQLHSIVLDTGSADLAVAASANTGCPVYYDHPENCHGEHLHVEYGDEGELNTFWDGHVCHDEVTVGDVSLGNMAFAGIETHKSFVECNAQHNNTGILGLAFSAIMGPPSNYSKPFLQIFHEQTGLPRVFAFQMCAWVGDSEYEKESLRSYGSWDLGGVNTDHYDSDSGIFWTPILEPAFYAVDLVDIRVGELSVIPEFRRPATTFPDEGKDDDKMWPRKDGESWRMDLPVMPQAIIDTGTSDSVLPAALYDPMIQIYKTFVTLSEPIWAGDECLPLDFDLKVLPPLVFVFRADEASSHKKPAFGVSIPACRLFARASARQCAGDDATDAQVAAGKPGLMSTIQRADGMGIILGAPVFNSYYVVHDWDIGRAGFAHMRGCDSTDPCPLLPVIPMDLPSTPLAQVDTETIWSISKAIREDKQAKADAQTTTLPDRSVGVSVASAASGWSFSGIFFTAFFLVSVFVAGVKATQFFLHKQRADYEVITDQEPASHL